MKSTPTSSLRSVIFRGVIPGLVETLRCRCLTKITFWCAQTYYERYFISILNTLNHKRNSPLNSSTYFFFFCGKTAYVQLIVDKKTGWKQKSLKCDNWVWLRCSPYHSQPCSLGIKVSLKNLNKVGQKAENWDCLFIWDCSATSSFQLYRIIPFQPHVIFFWIFLQLNCLGTTNCWVKWRQNHKTQRHLPRFPIFFFLFSRLNEGNQLLESESPNALVYPNGTVIWAPNIILQVYCAVAVSFKTHI